MKTKNSSFKGILAIILCIAMLAGTTYAWFTDLATSKDNTIQAGKLDVTMEWANSFDASTWQDATQGAIFTHNNWEPGYTDVKYIKISNKGNLNLKWRLSLEAEGIVTKLADVIGVYCVNPATGNLTSLDGLSSAGKLTDVLNNTDVFAPDGRLVPGAEVIVAIAMHMDEEAGNEYKGLSLCNAGFSVKLEATQDVGESDSFGDQYDNNAEWPNFEMSFEATQSLTGISTTYDALATDVIIRHNESGAYAIVPAGTKLAAGATELKFTGKNVNANGNFADPTQSYDIHISGIAEDNDQCITVFLGKILQPGLGETGLKLYHEDVQMTRVNSVNDFAAPDQYTYDAETGAVAIYVKNFSVFSAVQSTASKWEDDTVADTSWYNENDTEFTLEDVADFLGFRDLVDSGNTFEGKTVKLNADIDLNGKLFNPIGGGWAYQDGKTFNGTFDGANHTIYNLYVNGWELDEAYPNDKHTCTSKGAGLFSSIHNATIKNLAICGAELVVETTSIGVVVGCAQGKCTFTNIIVSDAVLGNYQMRNGGIVGDIYVIDSDNVPEGEYSHTFKNIVVDSTVKLCSMWGDFDTGNGGVIGGKYGSAKVLMENVVVAAELDVFSDVTAAYQWYAYRRCGMLVGYTGQNSPKQATNASADFLTCVNVNVYYGDWTNYTYYQFANQTDEAGNRLWNSNYPWVRAEESDYNGPFSNVRYGNPIINGEKINTIELAEVNKTAKTAITFNQLYGGGQGVYGTNEHNGVTIINDLENAKTVYICNDQYWKNLKFKYWFGNGKDEWTTSIDGIDMSNMLVEGNLYKITLPAYVTKIQIVGDDENETSIKNIDELSNTEAYNLDWSHAHLFVNNECDCGCEKVTVTVNIPNYATANNWTDKTQYLDIKVNGAITITASRGDNNAKYYTNGNNWRIYQSENGTFTISSTEGNILSAKVTYIIENTGILVLKETAIKSEEVVSVNDTSATFSVGNTTSATNGQVRITEIEVVYLVMPECEHSNTIVETKAPTCIADGYTAKKCVDCGKLFDKIDGDPATGHDYEKEVTKEANCTETGIRKFTCKICQGSYSETIQAKGHSYDEGVVTIPATCTTAGVKTCTCTACGETSTEPIEALGHSFNGNSCSECGEMKSTTTKYTFSEYAAGTQYADNEVHKLDDNVTVVTTDCHFTSELRIYSSSTYNGYAIIKSVNPIMAIDVNAGNKADTLDIYGSNDEGITWTQVATISVTSTSYKDYAIRFDDGQYKWLKLDVNGSNQVRLKSMTLTTVNSGDQGGDTPVCEHTNTTTTTVDATCTEAGSITVTCNDCKTTISEENVPALGHTYVDGTCSVCSAIDPNYGGNTEKTATLSFADKAQRTSFSTTAQVWEQNGITFTNNKASSSNAVADYSKPVRLYASSNVVIEALGNITKIVFDCNSSSHATALENSIGTVSGATVTVSSDKVTIEFTSSVESFTIAKLTAQVRLDSITVTYIA